MRPSSATRGGVRKLSHLVSEQNIDENSRPSRRRGFSSSALTDTVPSDEHRTLRHVQSLDKEMFRGIREGADELAEVAEELENNGGGVIGKCDVPLSPARRSVGRLRPLPNPIEGGRGRMSPLRRAECDISVNEDVLFINKLRQEQDDLDGEASSRRRKQTPVNLPGAGCTARRVDELTPPLTDPLKTLRAKAWSIAIFLRLSRVTNHDAPPKKRCWRSKIRAITSVIRLGRKIQPEIQKEDRLDGSAESSIKKNARRKHSAIQGHLSDATLAPEAQKSLHLVKAFGKNSRDLLSIVARQDQSGVGKFPAMDALKVLLSSDKSTDELVDLAYDSRKLHHECKTGLQRHAKEEKKRIAMEEADNRQRRGRIKNPPRRASVIQAQTEEDARRLELGCGMPKETFAKFLAAQNPMAANQMVVARLMQALVDLNGGGNKARRKIVCLRWYKCLDPDSWFINMWTIVYMALILHITTVGLFNLAFREGITGSQTQNQKSPSGDCQVSFSAEQWFDAAVDLFFIVDIFCRLFLFGQIVETKSEKGKSQNKMEVVVDPEQVLRNYASKSLAVDLVTATPIQWISMVLEAACLSDNAAAFLLARTLRIFRITRVVKLFRTYKVRMWMRRLKRMTGSTSIMQMLHLVLGLAFLNHIWTCLSWLVQSIDEEGFEDYTDYLGIKPTSSEWAQYSVMFMNTLQTIFAIQPYRGDTPLEAWFGSLTLALSIFISATMLSKILEIWQMANEAQTQRDSRINTVMQFTSMNGITTDLRNEVLDYFEFRYSNPAADFEKRFLDDLPTEMQARVISQMFPGALEKSALFTGSGEMFIGQLIVRMARRPMPTMPQQVILAQGAFGSEMFLLKSGTVEVATVDEEGHTVHVQTLGPGSTFGDLSMWMDSRHSATVTSLEFCQLHLLTRQDLEEALQSFPETVPVIASQALAHCIRSVLLAPALEGISKSAAERMGRRMAHKRVEFEPGEALYLEGEDADKAFIIRKGKVDVELLDGRLEWLDDVRCIGFEALLSCHWYQETVRAKETVVAYSISSQDIVDLFIRDKDLLEKQEAVADRQFQRMAHKLLQLRWMLLSQDLLTKHYAKLEATSSRRFADNLMQSAFGSQKGNSGIETRSSKSSDSEMQLTDRFISLIRPENDDCSPLSDESGIAGTLPTPPAYSRPPTIDDRRDS